MASGKSTLGALFSDALNMGFFDIDAEIEMQAAMSVSEIFANFGEAHFRNLESRLCKEMRNVKNCVIATGGGIVLRSANVNYLRESCLVVYLVADAETLLSRMQNENSRPLLADGDKTAKIQALLAERRELYENCADIILNTNDKSISESLQELIDIISVHIATGESR